MDIFNNARQHFMKTRSEVLGEIKVPEWGDGENPAIIYVRTMNVEEDMGRQEFVLKNDILGFNVATLIYTACNQDLKPIFSNTSIGFQQVKRELDSRVVTRIVAEINKILEKSTGDLEPEKKN